MSTIWNKLDSGLSSIYLNYLQVKEKGRASVARVHPAVAAGDGSMYRCNTPATWRRSKRWDSRPYGTRETGALPGAWTWPISSALPPIRGY